MNGSGAFDQAVDNSHQALDAFVRGDSGPLKARYSHREDVSLANPFGPPVHGWQQVSQTMELAATRYRDGKSTGFEAVARYQALDLAAIVEVEHYQAKVGGRPDITPVTLRVTSIFRPEDGVWKIIHRHADPITSAQGAASVIQS